VPSSDPEDWPRITEVTLEPENVKYRNTQFLLDDGQVYETGLSHSQQELRKRIWRVRNGDIRTLFQRFPTDEPLREQCALWVHAVVGKHFFPDANHRTAVATLRKLLADNGITYASWDPDRLEVAREESHTVRREIDAVELDTLYRRDELYEVWLAFFTDELKVVTEDER
jgi:hypothetical protein